MGQNDRNYETKRIIKSYNCKVYQVKDGKNVE